MSAVLQIIGFLCLCALLSLHYREELVQTAPIATALVLLLLFVLALFRALSLCDLFAAALILLCLWSFFRCFGRQTPRRLAELLLAPRALALYTMLLLAFLFMRGTCLTNRDDLGCWAIEVKSVCFYGGFAPKHLNAAPAFGSYFPGATLFRWWLCHLAGEYREGLLMVASAWLFVLLLSPILSFFSFRERFAPVVGLVGGAFLLVLPGVFDYMPYQSICAEPLMSSALAEAWITLLAPKRNTSKASLAACLICLCLFKSIGILHALGLGLFVCLTWKKRSSVAREESTLAALHEQDCVLGTAACLIPPAVWLIFCAVKERSNYFSVSFGQEAAVAGLPAKYGRSLIMGFFSSPAHFTTDGVLDLTPFALLLLLSATAFLAWKMGCFQPEEGKILVRYYAAAFLVFFLGLLLVHSFVFQEEMYLEPPNMAASFSRYGEPLLLGAALFLFARFTQFCQGRTRLLALGGFFACALVCTCMWTIYYRIIDNEAARIQADYFRAEIREKNNVFLARCEEWPDSRVLFLIDENNELQDLERATLQYLAAPCSVVFVETTDGDGNDPEYVSVLSAELHVNWVFP